MAEDEVRDFSLEDVAEQGTIMLLDMSIFLSRSNDFLNSVRDASSYADLSSNQLHEAEINLGRAMATLSHVQSRTIREVTTEIRNGYGEFRKSLLHFNRKYEGLLANPATPERVIEISTELKTIYEDFVFGRNELARLSRAKQLPPTTPYFEDIVCRVSDRNNCEQQHPLNRPWKRKNKLYTDPKLVAAAIEQTLEGEKPVLLVADSDFQRIVDALKTDKSYNDRYVRNAANEIQVFNYREKDTVIAPTQTKRIPAHIAALGLEGLTLIEYTN